MSHVWDGGVCSPVHAASQGALHLLSQRTSTYFRTTYIPVIARTWEKASPTELASSSKHESDWRIQQWTLLHQGLTGRVGALTASPPRAPLLTAALLGSWCVTGSGSTTQLLDVASFALPIMTLRLGLLAVSSLNHDSRTREVEEKACIAADWSLVWSSSGVWEGLPSAHVQALCSISDEAFQATLPGLQV
jgi:hypothetical protein